MSAVAEEVWTGGDPVNGPTRLAYLDAQGREATGPAAVALWLDGREQRRKAARVAELMKTSAMMKTSAGLAEPERFAKEVARQKHELLVREEARRQIAAEHRAEQPMPPAVSLSDLLAEPDEPMAYRVDGLWPSGGRVVQSAPMKAGKTTMRNNLVKALVDGDPFLGEFAVEQVRKVVVIDNEMDRGQVKRWLRAQGIKNTDRVEVVSLRGRVGTFDLLDHARRAEWVKVVQGADVVMLDCLRPVLDALGLDEHRDAGSFLVAFDALLAEAGVSEALVVHHTGHAGERSRGDSRIRDWPDAEWRIVRDTENDSKPRFFRAFGRDVDVPEGRLTFDPVTRHLTYVEGENRRNTIDPKVLAEALGFVRANPGANTTAIKEVLGVKSEDANVVVSVCRRDYLLVEDGPRGAKLHTLSPAGEMWLAEHVAGGKLIASAEGAS